VIDAAAVPRSNDGAESTVNNMARKASSSLVVSPEEYITGSPETVAEQIIDQCRRLGAGNIMAYIAPTLDEGQIIRNYQLWKQVLPILASADIPVPIAA